MKLPEKLGGGEVITLPSGFPSRHLPFYEQVTHPSVHPKKRVKIWQKSDPTAPCRALPPHKLTF